VITTIRQRNLFLALNLILALSANAQSRFARFRHFSTDQGFNGGGNKVFARDSLGFLWIGHRAGLTRFDGYKFTDYKANASDSLALPMEVVSNLFVDREGSLWAGFPNRLSFYDRKIDGFITYTLPLSGKSPKSVLFENEKTVWIGTTRENGLFRFDPQTRMVENYLNDQGSNDSLQNVARNSIHAIDDSEPFLLLGTSNGLWKFDKASKKFSRPRCNAADSVKLLSGIVRKIIRHPDHVWFWIDDCLVKVNTSFTIVQTLSFEAIHERVDMTKKNREAAIIAIEQDAAGNFWLGSTGLGIIRYNPETGDIVNYRNDPKNDYSLPSDFVNNLLIDSKQNVWASMSNKGFAQLITQRITFYNYLLGITAVDVAALPGKIRNTLWVTTQGYGLWTAEVSFSQMASLNFSKFKIALGQKGFEHLTRIWKGHDRLWIGLTIDGVIGLPLRLGSELHAGEGLLNIQPNRRIEKNTIGPGTVHALLEDQENNLWIGRQSQGLDIVHLKKKYGEDGSVSKYLADADEVSGAVRSIFPENDNAYWIGSLGGLRLFQNGKIEMINPDLSVIRIAKASDGTLLLATTNGLYEGAKSNNKYTFTKAPLPGNPYITALEEDKLGRLWLATYDGLFFYDRAKRFSLLFRKEDGLPSSKSTPATGSTQIGGVMAFGNEEGLVVFDPLSLRISADKPHPVITQLKINNRLPITSSQQGEPDAFVLSDNITTLKQLTLRHTHNILTLEFSAMDFAAPEKNQYRYKLLGFDEDWVQTDWKNRTATYTNLHAGTYVFKVMASNSDGIWSDYESSLAITVLPPPWKTWWAYLCYSLLLTTLLFQARRNIIQKERLNAKLKLEHLELEKAKEVDRLKSSFFTNISHEFRTPLTLIQGPVQLLMEQFSNNAKVKERLILIQNNSNLLLKLINQLLELARLESGKLTIDMAQTDLNSFLRASLESFYIQASQKSISFHLQLPNKRYVAEFDKDKLETILINLIGNAIKFTGAGGTVSVLAEVMHHDTDAGNGQSNLNVIIADTGIGIATEEHGRIFDRFYQVSESHKEIGTGIGLTLVKELTELLSGSIELMTSKPGEGSKFRLVVPVILHGIQEAMKSELKEEDFLDVSKNKDQLLADRDAMPKILIVEDNSDLRSFIISAFEKKYTFIVAADGKEGYEKATQELPEIIISDLMMPEMDGIKMTSKLKRDLRTSHIPIILLTAKATEESKIAGLEIGADDYLTKPFNTDELILKVKNIIDSRVKIREKIRLELLKESPKIEAQSADEQFLLRVKDAILRHLNDEQLSVEKLADEIGISRSQLYRKVIALTGVSMNELIRNFRLQKAAQLLSQKWGPVSQIAFEVGFSNLSYFTKCFKEQFGTTPSEYGTAKRVPKTKHR